MKLYLQNFGCKVNQIETQSLGILLVQHGWEICTQAQDADAIVINSCTVTASGDHRMRTELRKLRSIAPHAAIVLTGCYVQAFPDEAAALSEADLLIGTKERSRLPDMLSLFMGNRRQAAHIPKYKAGDSFECLPVGADSGYTRAFLKIQDGCDRFCTYCIIPHARGGSRSISAFDLVHRAHALAAQGYQEIVLCGINLACFGQEEGLNIADAADICAKIGFQRVRLGSLEPDGLTEEVLQKLSENPAFCPQFHISLQSGCDRTLQAMGRRYTSRDYAALLENIRRLFPDCAITTDIMTGFPGETEEDFAETLRFAREMAFAKIHIFRYSRRPGTAADRMPDQIPEAVKKQRADALGALEKQMRLAYLNRFVGKALCVLFEREKSDGCHNGHAQNGISVRVPASEGEASFRGSIRTVKITGFCEGYCIGTCTEQETL